jgi:hypothetical protein
MSDLYDRVMSFLTQRRRAYKMAFGSPAGKEVLKDLATFCRARETCVVAERGHPVDRERTLVLEGRREVFLRISQHMNLTEPELYALFGGPREAVDG